MNVKCSFVCGLLAVMMTVNLQKDEVDSLKRLGKLQVSVQLAIHCHHHYHHHHRHQHHQCSCIAQITPSHLLSLCFISFSLTDL